MYKSTFTSKGNNYIYDLAILLNIEHQIIYIMLFLVTLLSSNSRIAYSTPPQFSIYVQFNCKLNVMFYLSAAVYLFIYRKNSVVYRGQYCNYV
jgi:hypothetical protein